MREGGREGGRKGDGNVIKMKTNKCDLLFGDSCHMTITTALITDPETGAHCLLCAFQEALFVCVSP